ncbi:MAG: polysaccharide deacetylase family protein [Clostridium sp.]|jgi:peptidoglycan-N-acetylmuramic acid deacetylase|nr:polysaccharide deacetylase family protein [Clostridium sp.]
MKTLHTAKENSKGAFQVPVKQLRTKLLRVWIPVALLLVGMFYAGRGLAYVTHKTSSTEVHSLTAENWGLGFGAKGTQPSGNVSAQELSEYDAYYVGDPQEKVIYLTFDCGYENGNTQAILDALKKHRVKATFFVVGHFIESAPDIVKQMVKDGHSVGNHTYHHPDMSAISTQEEFAQELTSLETAFVELTGEKLAPYYRPPQGKFSTQNLTMAKELGYSTYFWSLAYVDWLQDDQPTREEALEKLTGRIHPGAIVLLHSTSSTNAEILDELLTTWKDMGYTFSTLDKLSSDKSQPQTE